MSLYSLCSYFSVLCCCGCWNSIFFHGAKIRISSESAKSKSYTGGRKSVSVGEYAMVHTCNSWRPSVSWCGFLILWIPMVDRNSTETQPKLNRNRNGVDCLLSWCWELLVCWRQGIAAGRRRQEVWVPLVKCPKQGRAGVNGGSPFVWICPSVHWQNLNYSPLEQEKWKTRFWHRWATFSSICTSGQSEGKIGHYGRFSGVYICVHYSFVLGDESCKISQCL